MLLNPACKHVNVLTFSHLRKRTHVHLGVLSSLMLLPLHGQISCSHCPQADIFNLSSLVFGFDPHLSRSLISVCNFQSCLLYLLNFHFGTVILRFLRHHAILVFLFLSGSHFLAFSAAHFSARLLSISAPLVLFSFFKFTFSLGNSNPLFAPSV